MSAKDEILGRVRRGVGKDDFAGRRAAAVASLATMERGPQPTMNADLAARFRAKAEYLSSTVAGVASLAEAPAAVAAYSPGLTSSGCAGTRPCDSVLLRATRK